MIPKEMSIVHWASSETYMDGYPAVANILPSSVGPGNCTNRKRICLYFSSQSIGGTCTLIDSIENTPYNDTSLALPTHPLDVIQLEHHLEDNQPSQTLLEMVHLKSVFREPAGTLFLM